MGWLMQVLSVRGAQRFMIQQPRASFKLKVETDSNNTAFQGRPRLKPALPGARALIEDSARDPHPPTTIAPTGTKPRRSVVVARL